MHVDTEVGAFLSPRDVEKAYRSGLVTRKCGLRLELRFQEESGGELPVNGIHGFKGGKPWCLLCQLKPVGGRDLKCGWIRRHIAGQPRGIASMRSEPQRSQRWPRLLRRAGHPRPQ